MTDTRSRMLCALALLLATAAAHAAPLFDDHDWRAPAAAAKVEGIERGMAPELLLKTEAKEPVLLFDPTEDETITYITDFKGELYLASCTQPAATATGSVFTYDPETNQWTKVFLVNDEGLVRLEVYGDRLYIAGYDANDGGWDLGNIYAYDGEKWIEHRTVPRAIHEYGLAVYRDRLYVSGDILDPPPPGMTVDEAGQKDVVAAYGRVVSSGDGGLTWREDYRGQHRGQDIGFMTVFRDKLVVNSQGDLVTFDGTRWQRMGLNPDVLVVYDYADAGDVLLVGSNVGLGFFDGKRFWRSAQLDPWQIRALTRFGNSWVAAGYLLGDVVVSHGPGGTGYPSTDQQRRASWDSGLWLLSDTALDKAVRGRPEPDGYQPTWYDDAQRISSPELLTAAHAFRGRLYLGTHPSGRVLVLPVVKEGTLESAPRQVPEDGNYRLTWEAATPPGTSCRFQIRWAPGAQVLPQAPFTGPDGTTNTSYNAPGAAILLHAGYVQYRVTLSTDNPALTPYLKRVTLSR